MAKPNARSIRSKQKGLLRYIVSTDVDTAAKDFGVSTDQLKRFINAKPETAKNTSRFDKLLGVNPTEVAVSKQIKLVQKLSGKRLAKTYGNFYGNERRTKAVRLAQATRERHKVTVDGQTIYKPLMPTKAKIARKQILNNLGGTTSASIMQQYHEGTLDEDEARSMLADLFRNSDATGSQEYFDDHD